MAIPKISFGEAAEKVGGLLVGLALAKIIAGFLKSRGVNIFV